MALSIAKMKYVIKQKHFPFGAILRISRSMYFNWISGKETQRHKQSSCYIPKIAPRSEKDIFNVAKHQYAH